MILRRPQLPHETASTCHGRRSIAKSILAMEAVMKSPKFLFLILAVLILGGCNSMRSRSNMEAAKTAQPTMAEDRAGYSKGQSGADNEPRRGPTQVSLNQADQSQSMAEAMNRKIIRNAELTLEVGA